MLNKIIFNSKFTSNDDFVDLLDCLLLYDQIILLTNSISIQRLLQNLGIDLLIELQIRKRLNLLYHDNVFGPGLINNDDLYLSTYTSTSISLEGLLYDYNRNFVKNSTLNNAFASKHSDHFKTYSYPLELTNIIYSDLQNESLINNYFKIYLKSLSEVLSTIQIDIHFKPNGREFLGRELYTATYSGDFDSFIQQFRDVVGYDYSVTDFLLQYGISKGDFLLAGDLDSEISNPMNLEFFREMSFDIFNRNVASNFQINSFEEYVFSDFTSIGKAFIEQKISTDTLLKLYDSTQELRSHIRDLADSKNIVGEYNKLIEVDFNLANKSDSTIKFILSNIVIKSANFMIKTIVPPPLLDIASEVVPLAVDAFGHFGYDKIKKGWQPKGKLTEFENLKKKFL
ncbi:hypothetical protein [Sphingobacterium arenae]|uniref:Uncharacterized protein n=1 Tax=Sphingobacterium arenae TaxID=1280598 RepID=A0ABR7Y311_9SPHI|nr:hypothetical protein [Sphingobacterium arenae]MBD1425666.1 hypothetical protein [Sphingobacterium arenae]